MKITHQGESFTLACSACLRPNIQTGAQRSACPTVPRGLPPPGPPRPLCRPPPPGPQPARYPPIPPAALSSEQCRFVITPLERDFDATVWVFSSEIFTFWVNDTLFSHHDRLSENMSSYFSTGLRDGTSPPSSFTPSGQTGNQSPSNWGLIRDLRDEVEMPPLVDCQRSRRFTPTMSPFASSDGCFEIHLIGSRINAPSRNCCALAGSPSHNQTTATAERSRSHSERFENHVFIMGLWLNINDFDVQS